MRIDEAKEILTAALLRLSQKHDYADIGAANAIETYVSARLEVVAGDAWAKLRSAATQSKGEAYREPHDELGRTAFHRREGLCASGHVLPRPNDIVACLSCRAWLNAVTHPSEGEKERKAPAPVRANHETHRWSGPLVMPTVCIACGVHFLSSAALNRCAVTAPAVEAGELPDVHDYGEVAFVRDPSERLVAKSEPPKPAEVPDAGGAGKTDEEGARAMYEHCASLMPYNIPPWVSVAGGMPELPGPSKMWWTAAYRFAYNAGRADERQRVVELEDVRSKLLETNESLQAQAEQLLEERNEARATVEAWRPVVSEACEWHSDYERSEVSGGRVELRLYDSVGALAPERRPK